MKVDDYIDYIMREIALFECTYNKSPEKIIMSSALAQCLMNGFIMYKNEDDGFYHATYVGIPLRIYSSDKLECHLVEHTLSFS